jgi:hypothetical protein
MDLQLVLAGFLDVQYIHSRRFNDDFDWICALSQMLWLKRLRRAKAGTDRPNARSTRIDVAAS